MAIRLCTVDSLYSSVNGEKWKYYLWINSFEIAKYEHISNFIETMHLIIKSACSNNDCESNRENSIIYVSPEALKKLKNNAPTTVKYTYHFLISFHFYFLNRRIKRVRFYFYNNWYITRDLIGREPCVIKGQTHIWRHYNITRGLIGWNFEWRHHKSPSWKFAETISSWCLPISGLLNYLFEVLFSNYRKI